MHNFGERLERAIDDVIRFVGEQAPVYLARQALREQLEADTQRFVLAILQRYYTSELMHRPGEPDRLSAMAFSFAKSMETYLCAALEDSQDRKRGAMEDEIGGGSDV